MIHLQPRSLRSRLLMLVMAAAIFPALGITWVLRSISAHVLEKNIEQVQHERAHRVADDINKEIHSAQLMLAYAARELYQSQMRVGDTRAVLDNLIRSVPSFEEVMVVVGSGQERIKRNRQGYVKELIKRPVSVQKSFISEPFFSGKQLPTLLVSEPIRMNASSMGSAVLMAKMSFSSLGALMEKTRLGESGSAFIVNEKGTILAHPLRILVLDHSSVAERPVFQSWSKNLSRPTKLVEEEDPVSGALVSMAYPIPLLRSAVVIQEPTRQVFAPLRRMNMQYVLWATLWLVLFLGITWFVALRILQPLRQLHEAVAQLGRGDQSVSLNIQTHDELQELGETFNKTVQSLRQAEGMRQDFTHMLVHDLKAPLNSMMTSVEFLLAGERGPLAPDQKSFLQMAYRSGHDLLSMVQDLLDVGKMEEGKLRLQPEPVVLSVWVKPILDSFRPQVESQKKKLELELDADLPRVYVDRMLMTRTLRNLLMNAFHHTFYAVGEIRVKLQRDKEGILLSVHDNGEGIDPDDMPRLFEKFSTFHSAPSKRAKGSGIGLAFCKMSVELNHGTLTVESQKGEGSVFRIWLPSYVETSTPESIHEVSQETIRS